MRHSSWTLFLVPLALPLLLLCLPGSMKAHGHGDAAAGNTTESPQQAAPLAGDISGLSLGSGDPTYGSTSEVFFQD